MRFIFVMRTMMDNRNQCVLTHIQSELCKLEKISAGITSVASIHCFK